MLSISNDYDTTSMDETRVTKSCSITHLKMKHRQNACAICGAKSTGINFDVLTCSSCKAFFRRNGVKPLHQFVCRSSGECNIDERSRRHCTACRLRKCFAMGMIKERIRTEEQNQRHRALVEENRRQKVQKYHHQQQKENRTKTYDDEIPYKRICSTSSCSLSDDQLHQTDFIFELFVETTRQTINEDFALTLDCNLTDVLNLYCAPISCLITFFKQISQFQQLPVDDRLILLKNNIKTLLPILTHLLNTTFGVELLVKHPGVCNINDKIAYAYSLFASVLPDDNKLLSLLIVLFLFCPCAFTSGSLYDAGSISDPSRQLIQYAYDEYAQLLWCYIIEKYDDDEHRAALTYMKIVTTFLQLQNVTCEIYDIVECSVQIDQLHLMMQSVLHLT